MSYVFAAVVSVASGLIAIILNYVLDPAIDEAAAVFDFLMGIYCQAAGVQYNGFSDFLSDPFVKGCLAFLHVIDAWVPVKETIAMASILTIVTVTMTSVKIALRLYHELPGILGFEGGKT